MRLMLASLIAATGYASFALAQTTPEAAPPPATQPPAAAAPTTAAPPPSAPATPMTAAPPGSTPATPPSALPGAAPEAAPAAPEAPPAPPPPPPPPTDPVAIALLDTLQNVCIPAIEGGKLDKLAKADGYRKSGEDFVLSRKGYKFTILAPGSNPDQCHVDMVHPVYPEAPAAPIVVALHNWANVERDWTLYRNDKSVQGNQLLTTRSWEHDDPGKHEAMFITTFQHADGTPMQHDADTSTMVYSENKTGS